MVVLSIPVLTLVAKEHFLSSAVLSHGWERIMVIVGARTTFPSRPHQLFFYFNKKIQKILFQNKNSKKKVFIYIKNPV